MAFGIKKETPHYREFSGGASQNTASTTAYAPSGGTSNYSGTEKNRQIVISRNCKITNLKVITTSSQPATGSMVFTLRKNGVDTALTLTIAAATAAGTFENTANEVSFSAGDLLSLKSVNNATSNGAELVAWSILTT